MFKKIIATFIKESTSIKDRELLFHNPDGTYKPTYGISLVSRIPKSIINMFNFRELLNNLSSYGFTAAPNPHATIAMIFFVKSESHKPLCEYQEDEVKLRLHNMQAPVKIDNVIIQKPFIRVVDRRGLIRLTSYGKSSQFEDFRRFFQKAYNLYPNQWNEDNFSQLSINLGHAIITEENIRMINEMEKILLNYLQKIQFPIIWNNPEIVAVYHTNSLLVNNIWEIPINLNSSF